MKTYKDIITEKVTGDKPFFGKLGEFSFAVKLNNVTRNDFPKEGFRGEVDNRRAVDEFKKTAKKDGVDAKGKATLTAVKSWVKDNNPKEFYAKWKSDSKYYKDDGVSIFYK